MKKIYLTLILILFIENFYSQNPIAHFKFDNSLNDETGNWNLTASSGFTPTFVTGQDGNVSGAVSGFGVEDFLTTSSNFSPFNGGVDRTITAWVKLPATAAGKNLAVVGLGNNDENFQKFTFGTISSNGATESRNRVEVRGNGKTGNTNLAVDSWIHIAVTYTSTGTSTFKLYINGAFDSEKTINSAINTGENPLLIGNDYTLNATTSLRERGWLGAIDDLKFFDSILTETEIASIYNATLSVKSEDINEVMVFPMPMEKNLIINNKDVNLIEVYNVLGKREIQTKVNRTNTVDVSSLASGLYIIKLFNDQDQLIGTLKTLKK